VVDAASADAANGTITIAAFQDGSSAGSIELCNAKARLHYEPQEPGHELRLFGSGGEKWRLLGILGTGGKHGQRRRGADVLQGLLGIGPDGDRLPERIRRRLDIDVNGNLVFYQRDHSCGLRLFRV